MKSKIIASLWISPWNKAIFARLNPSEDFLIKALRLADDGEYEALVELVAGLANGMEYEVLVKLAIGLETAGELVALEQLAVGLEKAGERMALMDLAVGLYRHNYKSNTIKVLHDKLTKNGFLDASILVKMLYSSKDEFLEINRYLKFCANKNALQRKVILTSVLRIIGTYPGANDNIKKNAKVILSCLSEDSEEISNWVSELDEDQREALEEWIPPSEQSPWSISLSSYMLTDTESFEDVLPKTVGLAQTGQYGALNSLAFKLARNGQYEKLVKLGIGLANARQYKALTKLTVRLNTHWQTTAIEELVAGLANAKKYEALVDLTVGMHKTRDSLEYLMKVFKPDKARQYKALVELGIGLANAKKYKVLVALAIVLNRNKQSETIQTLHSALVKKGFLDVSFLVELLNKLTGQFVDIKLYRQLCANKSESQRKAILIRLLGIMGTFPKSEPSIMKNVRIFLSCLSVDSKEISSWIADLDEDLRETLKQILSPYSKQGRHLLTREESPDPMRGLRFWRSSY